MTPLEQFNEEVRRDIDIHFDKNFEFHGSYLGIRDFFLERLQAHKSLILKMVREKAPSIKQGSQNEGDSYAEIGWNDCRQEFLNNLDTI